MRSDLVVQESTEFLSVSVTDWLRLGTKKCFLPLRLPSSVFLSGIRFRSFMPVSPTSVISERKIIVLEGKSLSVRSDYFHGFLFDF